MIKNVPDVALLPTLLELVLVHGKGHIEVLSAEFFEAGVEVDVD